MAYSNRVITPRVAGPSVRVQLLGPVRAWHGDQEIELGTARRRAVFAILALSADQAVSQAELVDGLWGEEPSTKAIGTLHTYIYDLRRALRVVTDSSVLTTLGQSYSLRAPLEHIDEQRFLRHHEAAQRHWERGNLARAADELDAALALWHGEALEGLAEPFAGLHRARLGELRLMARERRAAARLALGEHAATAGELADLVARHPLREGLRGLLMVALHRSGQDADALRLFEDTERVLVSELGIEPGPALRRIREKIATGTRVSPDDIGAGMWTPRDPGRATITMLSDGDGPEPPPMLVGRTRELGVLQPILTGLADGHGGCVWVEGDPGMGKTALLATAIADLSADCTAVWSAADRLTGADPGRDAVDRTVTLVAQACLQAPLVFVVEDLQRADDTALLLWHRLARLTLRLPLLLVGLASPAAQLKQLRNAVHAVGGRVLSLGPLSRDEVADLVDRRAGGSCGPALAELLEGAGGNPLFVNQLLDAGALRVENGVVELDESASLASATVVLLRRLGFLAPRTLEMVRWAALLGTVFSLADVATVMAVPAADLVGEVNEATAAGVLVEHGRDLAFRSEAVRRALYREWPRKIPARMPPETGPEALAVRRLRLLFALGAAPAAEARAVLHRATDPEHVAESRWILAQLAFFSGEVGHAHELLRAVDESQDAPETWKARCQALRAEFEHTEHGGVELATRTANAALARAENIPDPAAVADACREKWYLDSVRRDHQTALQNVDRALETVSDAPALVVRRLSLLDSRVYSLQNLDRLDEATAVLERMRNVARRYQVRTSRPQVAAAVHYYWTGQWDAAIAELASVTDDGPGAAHLDRRSRTGLLRHGVTALIAARRGDAETMRATLRAADETHPVVNTTDQENSDFLLAARAIDAGLRSGAVAEVAAMDPILDPGYGHTTLRHQWLPRMVRLAMSTGDSRRVRAALELCSVEAELEVVPARADAASRWCTALVAEDPASLLATARHFGEVGRPVEKAAILVDGAELTARRGEREQARQLFEDAWTIFTELGAKHDLADTEARMRACGVSHGATTPAVLGWHTLSSMERQVASLAAAAMPNSEIAAELALSRRDVQAHLSRTMQKLGATSRTDLADRIARAVMESP